MTEQPSGSRRRTREEIRVGYRQFTNASNTSTTKPTDNEIEAPLSARPQPVEPVEPLKPLKPPVRSKSEPAVVAINVQLPALNLKKRVSQAKQLVAKLFGFARNQRRTTALIVGAVVVLAAIGGGWSLLQNHRQSAKAVQGSQAGSAGGTSVASQAVAAEPTFTPLAPVSKPELAKVGTQSAFDGSRNVYSYVDVIAKQRVTVSQQQPGSDTAAAAAETASKSLNANKVVATTFGDIYINTNTKYNSQTVIASVKNILVFLQSSQIIADSDWKTYVDNLQ